MADHTPSRRRGQVLTVTVPVVMGIPAVLVIIPVINTAVGPGR